MLSHLILRTGSCNSLHFLQILLRDCKRVTKSGVNVITVPPWPPSLEQTPAHYQVYSFTHFFQNCCEHSTFSPAKSADFSLHSSQCGGGGGWLLTQLLRVCVLVLCVCVCVCALAHACVCRNIQVILTSCINDLCTSQLPLYIVSCHYEALTAHFEMTHLISSHYKDSAPFLSLVLPSGTISLSLCDMLKLCLP